MKKIILSTGLAFIGFCLFYACGNDPKDDLQAELDAKLNKIIKEYKEYSLFSTTEMHWSPISCVSGPQFRSREVFKSEADSSAEHGDRLYRLYVRDWKAYQYQLEFQPVGQVLVKETWEVTLADYKGSKWQEKYKTRSRNDGKEYMPDEIADLFIMYKDEFRKHTDNGWVYAVVSAADSEGNRKVLRQGKVDDCMECHQKAKRDRLFASAQEIQNEKWATQYGGRIGLVGNYTLPDSMTVLTIKGRMLEVPKSETMRRLIDMPLPKKKK